MFAFDSENIATVCLAQSKKQNCSGSLPGAATVVAEHPTECWIPGHEITE